MNIRSQRGDWRFGPIAGLVIVILAMIGLFAICSGDDDDANSLAPAQIQLVSHERSQCYDDYDCDDGYGRGGDGGESGGHQGYGGGGGRSGDYDGGDGDGDRCRNICNNTFPLPGSGDGGQR